MTLWRSADRGKTWDLQLVVNPKKTAYSSLVVMPDGERVGLLHERANNSEFIFLPGHSSFLTVWPHPTPTAAPAGVAVDDGALPRP
jgi:hypothetical protein